MRPWARTSRPNLINLNQVPTATFLDLVSRYGEAGAVSLMNSKIYSATAKAAGIPVPYANFLDKTYTPDSVQSVKQALRPYPQYSTINIGNQGGDRSGHSSYHAMVLKADRRLSGGLTFNFSYVLSKMITDAETAGSGSSTDQYNRRLEKALAGSDQTHVLKFSTVYELPFFRGKAFLGGWRSARSKPITAGTPIGVSRNNAMSIFNGASPRPFITTYEDWRAPIAGEKFDPAVDRFLDRTAFPAKQPSILGATPPPTIPRCATCGDAVKTSAWRRASASRRRCGPSSASRPLTSSTATRSRRALPTSTATTSASSPAPVAAAIHNLL